MIYSISDGSYWLKAISNPWYKLIFSLQSTINEETQEFYKKRGISNFLMPVTTGSISSPMGLGSDSLPVKVKIAGKDTYLADSMQFLLEYGCRFNDRGCYYIMPTFRGEDVDSRHLSQFFHSEAEIQGDLDDIINLATDYVKYLSEKIIGRYSKEISQFTGDLDHVINIIDNDFVRITFDEAEDILRKNYPEQIDQCITNNSVFRNITSLGEKKLLEYFHNPVWVTNYDNFAVPFYQKLDNSKTGTAKNADLLLGIGETIGCGERNHTVNTLRNQMIIHKVSEIDYNWYIEMRKHYPMQTAGFGMGVERFLLFILKHDDIRDVQIIRRFNENGGSI